MAKKPIIKDSAGKLQDEPKPVEHRPETNRPNPLVASAVNTTPAKKDDVAPTAVAVASKPAETTAGIKKPTSTVPPKTEKTSIGAATPTAPAMAKQPIAAPASKPVEPAREPVAKTPPVTAKTTEKKPASAPVAPVEIKPVVVETPTIPTAPPPIEATAVAVETATDTAVIEETAPAPVAEPPSEEPRHVHLPLDNKYLNKEALRHRLLLRMDYKPIISYVGRLDAQKGVHLIRHAIFYALANGSQFVLLGTSPDHRINDEFWHLKRHFNDNPDCHLEIGYNEELSHLIYAGSDMLIMPSLYEPCGLTQMIALKYGTVPIVRAVGGLADTVFDRDHSDRPMHERNGYVFHQADAAGLESAMRRAIGLWYAYPEEFRKLVINGMRYDYSWNHPGQHYMNIYEYIRCK